MQLNLHRLLAPVLVVTAMGLAGCKAPPTKAPESAAPAAPSQTAESASPSTSVPMSASPVEFYVAQAQPDARAIAVKLSDGSMVYLIGQPVLTRNDLTEAAALADRQGQNFVGLRFTEAGARKLNEVSRKNIGNMLALVVNRELVAAPRLAEPLNRGVMAFGVPSAQIAKQVAAKIRGDQAAPPTSAPARQPKPSKAPTPASRTAPAKR
jgi:preprotein translocase subunit SecD